MQRVLLAVVMLVLVACSGDSKSATPTDSTKPRIVHVPRAIASDCSRSTQREIMALLASVPDGGALIFPSRGCVGQDETILVADRSDLTIDGTGSTFVKQTPSDTSRPSNANWRIAGGRGVTLKNMIVKGSYEPPPRGTPGQGQFTDHGVSLWGSNDTSVLDVQVTNVDGECLTADSDIRKGTDYRLNPPTRNATVERLRCTHAGRQGIAATAVDGFTLSHSFIDDTQQTGVDIEIDAPGELARNVKILDNTFGAVYFAAIAVPLGDSPDVGNILIRGNKMMRAPDTCYAAVYIGDPRFRLRDIFITDNWLTTIGDGVRLTHVDSGEVARNLITRTNPENTACHNPALTPAESVPVRLIDSTVAIEANTLQGFAS